MSAMEVMNPPRVPEGLAYPYDGLMSPDVFGLVMSPLPIPEGS